MTYLYVDYPGFKQHVMGLSILSFLFLYNYNIMFHNRNMQFVNKAILGYTFFHS